MKECLIQLRGEWYALFNPRCGLQQFFQWNTFF
jgi:hypothetical protein